MGQMVGRKKYICQQESKAFLTSRFHKIEVVINSMPTKIRLLRWYLLKETDQIDTQNVLTTVTESCQTLVTAIVILVGLMPL